MWLAGFFVPKLVLSFGLLAQDCLQQRGERKKNKGSVPGLQQAGAGQRDGGRKGRKEAALGASLAASSWMLLAS